MKTFKQFNEQTKCPLGMKWDKKSKTCVPIITKTKLDGPFLGILNIGTYHHRTTNGKNGMEMAYGNGSHNGNGGGNGNGGNGNSWRRQIRGGTFSKWLVKGNERGGSLRKNVTR